MAHFEGRENLCHELNTYTPIAHIQQDRDMYERSGKGKGQGGASMEM